ncbi:sugar transporter [Echinicola soli]|uniref:Sugar transporter n=1 Tax=Echinicola soli TaxID=2591634 RepID=A0A514CI81_9BACT|nr:polysaccharide biosynthesis/export family protein [Echinicola soli]QDH79539.1 sugar transporter [Echinicola soli]
MNKLLFAIPIALLMISCVSNKRLNYLQNLPENEPIDLDEFIPYAAVDYEYILQPFDIVDIDFASSDEELTKVFEYQGARNTRGSGGGNNGGDPYYFTGYSIDKDGAVRIPKLGRITIAGLSEEEARAKIETEINQYFKEEVYVRLRIGGIRFTTIGEFNSSGTKVIYKNRATIFDAIALAGESDILAKKNELFLIRQYDGGTKIHQINLNDRALLASPYYFIQPNDILYLQPMSIRQVGDANNLATTLQLAIGLVTAVLFFVALTKN